MRPVAAAMTTSRSSRGSLGRKRHHLVGDDRHVEGLLVRAAHHLLDLLEFATGVQLLGRERGLRHLVEFFEPIDSLRLLPTVE